MTDRAATLRERIAVSEAAIAEWREELARIEAAEQQEEPDDLVDTLTVAERFNVTSGAVRYLCRDKCQGVRRNGRWLISLAVAREHFGH